MKKLWLRFLGILLLALIAASIVLPNRDDTIFGVKVPKWFPDKDMSLGLDLEGGTQLTYVIDLSKVPAERAESVVSGVEQVIERRINTLGVKEPVIQTAAVGNQRHLIVELPGIKDLDEAKGAVGKVVKLQFKEEKTEVTPEEEKQAEEENITLKKTAQQILAKAKSNGNLSEAASVDAKAKFTKSTDFEKASELDAKIAEALDYTAKNSVHSVVVETETDFVILKLIDKKTEQMKEVDASHILIAYQGADRASTDITRNKEEAKKRAEEVITKLKSGGDFATLTKEYTDEPGSDGVLPSPVKKDGSYVAQFTDATLALANINDYTETPVETAFGYHVIKARAIRFTPEKMVQYEQAALTKSIANATGWKETELSGEHFDFATAGFDQNTGQVVVNLNFNEKGKELFAAITKRNLNKPIAIFLDDKPIIGETPYAPVVRNEITDGKAQISGNLTHKEAIELSRNLNAGAIPAPISLIGQKTVGATLGDEALHNGLKAGLIGIILLFIYLFLYYRLSGLMASLALCIYSVLLLAVFKLWPVTLTLAGIAGVIFSIGVAVDANILIFERMKEELRTGKPMTLAINEGFTRAWLSIRDSNLSSLLTCAVLFFLGSGMIRGFAITLAIGILVSLFSAITVTRTFMQILIQKLKPNSFWLVGVKTPKNPS